MSSTVLKIRKAHTVLSFAISLTIAFGAAQAGKIVSGTSEPYAPNAPGFVAYGFGGWNLDNVEVVLSGTNSWFEESDGSYFFDTDSDFTYRGEVANDLDTVMGYVLAKDWPIGEPSGIKIVNDDLKVKDPNPTNCIMATSYLEDHYLDSTDPQQVLCSGPYQSHKRYKVAMLPTTVAGGVGAEEGIDLVFNVESEEGSRDYQVFQKINNWTNSRLEGFEIQIGTGIGSEFVPAGAGEAGVGLENLSLSVPGDVWDADQLANFSSGLFGPPDVHHDTPPGFFDPDTRAGFTIQEYPNVSGQTDKLRSGVTLGSDYANVPPGGSVDFQFGPWLPNTMLPQGIFWDDDGNPETDAALIAWFGYDPNSSTYTWMGGADTAFAPIPDETILEWGSNLEYTSSVIDDLVNVGLNYIVTVGDVSGFPSGTFTIRVTPAVDTSETPAPGYTMVTPTPSLVFTDSNGVVAVSPSPEFDTGAVLTARVGDADLNTDPEVVDEVDVTISTTTGLNDTLTLVEQGENRGVFAAILPDAYSDIAAGEVVTVTYNDADIGDGNSEEKTATTTAAKLPVVPDIKVNGVDGPLTTDFPILGIRLTVDAGDYVGEAAEWWMIAKLPSGKYYSFVLNRGWVQGVVKGFGGTIRDVTDLKIQDFWAAERGEHLFYFVIDTDIDGKVDGTFYDVVSATVE